MGGMLTDHQLEELATQHAFLVDQRNQIEDQLSELKNQIGTEMALRDVDRVDLKQYTTLVVQTPRTTLSETKLLEAGVPMETLEQCKERNITISIRVNPRKVQDLLGEKPKKGKKGAIATVGDLGGIAV